MPGSLRVGIIGASAAGGWAKDSHVPAVRTLAGLELVAVASSSRASANAAAAAFGAARGYASGIDLIGDPDVDIVSVAVKVPDHRELVLAAVAAGKHVCCEWPLGRNVAEAKEMAAAAAAAGVHTMIGLQARGNPAVRKAGEVIASGRLGRVLNARVYSTAAAFGPAVSESMLYAERPENGVDLVTIQGAHTIDLAIALLGPIFGATAMSATQYPQIVVGGGMASGVRSTRDYIAVQAGLAAGAPLTLEVVGGRPPDSVPFHFELTGEKGTLVLSGGAPRGFQSGRLNLSIDGNHEPVDAGETAPMPDAAVNVAGLYACFRDDINRGTNAVAGFEHAVRLARLVEDLLASSKEGFRALATGWPG
jgi:predicted dehydrogenase